MTTALQRQNQAVSTIRGLLEQSKAQIAMALPRHMDPDRLLRVAMTSIQKNPKLLDCDTKSLLGAVIQSAQLGLEPDGVLGQAYLIPYKTTCQFIPGYKGLIDLARRSGQIVSIASHCIYENDQFTFNYGLKETLEHIPARGNRGQMIGVYAVAILKDGGHSIEVMWTEDINKIRDKSSGYMAAIKYKKDHPWLSHYDEMARKTVIRRLCKYLPLSVELSRAVALDEQAEAGVFHSPVDFDAAIDVQTGEVMTTESKLEALNNSISQEQSQGIEPINEVTPPPEPKKPSIPDDVTNYEGKDTAPPEHWYVDKEGLQANGMTKADFIKEIDEFKSSSPLNTYWTRNYRLVKVNCQEPEYKEVLHYKNKRVEELKAAEDKAKKAAAAHVAPVENRAQEDERKDCPNGNGNVFASFCEEDCTMRLGCPAWAE